jgi:cytoskeletal protein RodZ
VTPPGGIGGKLQEARQRGGISLREIADSTKISVRVLQAIERNDISRIPAGVFGRAYVRSFASAVALDPEATVAEFVAQFPIGSVTYGYPRAEQATAAPADISPRRTTPSRVSIGVLTRDSSTLLRLGAVGILPVAVAVYWGATRGAAHRPASQRAIAGAHASVMEGAFAGLTRGASAFQALPLVPHDDIPRGPVTSPTPTELPAVPAAQTDAPGAGNPFAVVIAVSSPSWVIARVDGKEIVNRLFQTGDQQAVEAQHDLVLTAGDGGAIVMTINGRLAKSIGPPGQTVTTRVSSTNFRNYLRR